MTDAANAPMVSVVTVTFNSEEFIRGCCTSVAQNAGPTPSNTSSSTTIDGCDGGIVRTGPRVRLVENRMNPRSPRRTIKASPSGGRYVVSPIPTRSCPKAHSRRWSS